jgi:hypothetical protein
MTKPTHAPLQPQAQSLSPLGLLCQTPKVLYSPWFSRAIFGISFVHRLRTQQSLDRSGERRVIQSLHHHHHPPPSSSSFSSCPPPAPPTAFCQRPQADCPFRNTALQLQALRHNAQRRPHFFPGESTLRRHLPRPQRQQPILGNTRRRPPGVPHATELC